MMRATVGSSLKVRGIRIAVPARARGRQHDDERTRARSDERERGSAGSDAAVSPP